MNRIEDKTVDQRPAKRLLGIVGSTRKLGNCELFIKEISRFVPDTYNLRLIRLPELEIKPCIGCYQIRCGSYLKRKASLAGIGHARHVMCPVGLLR